MHRSFAGLRLLAPQSHRAATATAAPTAAQLVAAAARIGMDLSLKAGELKDKEATPQGIATKALAVKHNKEIVETLAANQSMEEVHYRKTARPWEIVPQWKRRRVVDLVGILESEHRMEMELTIEKVSMICDIDMHLVIVPTVGYVKPRIFAQSIFWDWAIGEPKGNGVLIVLSQGDASVQIVASPVLERWFAMPFGQMLVRDVLGPLLRQGNASYAVLMMTHAAAQYIDEMRPQWESRNAIVPQHVQNRLRLAERFVIFGVLRTSSFWTCVLLTALLVWLINRILDLYCPQCGALMHHVVDDAMLRKHMTKGQYLEHFHECTRYRVHKCPKCEEGKRVRVVMRDIYQADKCLPCHDCHHNTVLLQKTVMTLPTREADGVKQFMYTCENCNVARDIRLPLLRPLDDAPGEEWLSKLLARANKPQGENRKQKMI